MNIEEVLKLMQEVPDYQTFLTVDELNESMFHLAKQYPDVVELLFLGNSRQGAEIHAMKIGSGRKAALLYAMPHPNEPIGSMMLEFFSTRLAEDKALREALDYTWYIIKCIDVDGTRLNEGWFKGPFSITNYARHFYRPPGHLQVEWSFPLDYKDLHFNKPLPETRALMKLIREIKPDFVYSLHNSGFGGVYAYVSHDIPAFYPVFYKAVASENMPLHLGEAEVPYAQKFSDAIFSTISTEAGYDFLEANGVADPAAVINSGASSAAYASQYNKNAHYLVCEMPYFYNPTINDTSLSEMTRREITLQGLHAAREHNAEMQAGYEEIRELLKVSSPFRDSIENTLQTMPGYLAGQLEWARTDPSLSEPATLAEKFDGLLVHRFYDLLSEGMFVRMLRQELDEGGSRPQLEAAFEKMEKKFNSFAAQLEKDMDYEVVPIRKLANVQLGAGLLYASLVP